MGTVTVTYAGEVGATTQLGTGPQPVWSNAPLATFNGGGTIDNIPTADELIALTGGNSVVNTITFSAAVLNPIMAIASLGQSGSAWWTEYHFNQPFTILSFGPGNWGGPGTLTDLGSNILQGQEGNGLIQFQGSVTSISWTVPEGEFWHGFTVGEPVPEPATLLLLGSGLTGLAMRRRRRA